MNSKDALKKLQSIVDKETYDKILLALAGTTIYFPENVEWTDLEVRNSQIREDFFSGFFEIRDLANKYDLSISRIYKIIQSHSKIN